MVHLEETLKLEEQEEQLSKKIEFHQAHTIKEAEVVHRKEEENAAEMQELILEEGARRTIVKNMLKQSDDSLNPIKDVLVNLEGSLIMITKVYTYISSYFIFQIIF